MRRVTTAVSDIDERFRIHDFRVPSGIIKTVFDVEIPIEYKAECVVEMIYEKVKSPTSISSKIMIDRVVV